MSEQLQTVPAQLPEWYPVWVRELAALYYAGSTSLFVLHGNVQDFQPHPLQPDAPYVSLVDFLGEGVFGKRDVVLRYDLGHGLRVVAGQNGQRHQEMVRKLSAHFGEFKRWPNKPDEVLPALGELVERFLLTDDPQKRLSLAVLFEYPQYLIPEGGVQSLPGAAAQRIVRFLEWAESPYIKRVNIAFLLLTESLAELNSRIVNNPHLGAVRIPLPDQSERERFLQVQNSQPNRKPLAESDVQTIARLSNGLPLVSVDRIATEAGQSGQSFDESRLMLLKKQLLERQCLGLLEFVDPGRQSLDWVVGHEPVKERLRADAQLLLRGQLDAAPMGYLICGAVGTGKSFLAECYAGSIGIPVVKLRNFRSKYVGETEGNLELVLNVLRSLGPVLVIIDEADAALGDRDSGGDSGTSGRVFSMIATQMGNTRYRGQILWMLLTSRPDLLPIDLKRQGRAEVHMPLFYPSEPDELTAMFLAMAKKNGVKLSADQLPDFSHRPELSGADIESIVVSARRHALLTGKEEPGKAELQHALTQFLPSVQGLEKEMQEIAAVLECTDLAFLPEQWQTAVREPDGRARLQSRLMSLRLTIDD